MSDGKSPSAQDVPIPPCAFYCVSDSRHFPGVVALLNSLRLTGHDQPVFLVDSGLTPHQRRSLADHVTLVPAPAGADSVLLAPVGPTAHPAEVAVLLDADIIVVRSLAPLIHAARAGKLVGFVNDPPNDNRYFAQWGPALGLGRVPRRPYLNAGQFLIPRSLAVRILPPWALGQERIDPRWTRYGGGKLGEPFYFADQDVINAIVSYYLSDDEVIRLEHRLAPHPPFAGVRVTDVSALRCEYADGEGPYLLHHTLAKPWLTRTPANAYSQLMLRLLWGANLAVQLSPEQVPLRLREGSLATLDRGRSDLQARARLRVRAGVHRFGIRSRVAAGRRSRSTPEHSTPG